MPIVLQPIDQAAHAQLAQRLACWARTANGRTDVAVQYQTCCVSPTGQTLGRWVIPNDLCGVYGPFPFTGNDGEIIPCPPEGSAEYVTYYIFDTDVDPIDVDTCAESTLAAPTGLASPSQTATTVDLTWDAVEDAEAYVVRWAPAGTTAWTELDPVTDPEATITGLDPLADYDVQVKATAPGAIDSPWSATLTVTTESLGQLDAPEDVASPAQTTTTIDVTWTAVTNAEGYIVEWSPAGAGTWTSVPNADTSYTITGLDPDSAYDVRVAATADGWTDSDWSTVLTESTAQEQLAAPSGLASPAQTAASVDLSWSAVTDADTYTVRWSPAGAGTWTEENPAAGTSATVDGLEPATTYDFQVKAEADGFIDSDWSATLSQETTPLPVLPPPANVAAGTPTADSIPLSWDAVPDADTYTVGWRISPDGEWTEISSIAATSEIVDGLDPLTAYDLRVMAVGDGFTDSAWSDIVTETTTSLGTLAAPSGVNSPDQTETSVDLAWLTVTDADEYVVRWSPTGENDWTEIAPVGALTVTIDDLTAATVYDFEVKATAAGWTDSGWSSTLTQTTAG